MKEMKKHYLTEMKRLYTYVICYYKALLSKLSFYFNYYILYRLYTFNLNKIHNTLIFLLLAVMLVKLSISLWDMLSPIYCMDPNEEDQLLNESESRVGESSEGESSEGESSGYVSAESVNSESEAAINPPVINAAEEAARLRAEWEANQPPEADVEAEAELVNQRAQAEEEQPANESEDDCNSDEEYFKFKKLHIKAEKLQKAEWRRIQKKRENVRTHKREYDDLSWQHSNAGNEEQDELEEFYGNELEKKLEELQNARATRDEALDSFSKRYHNHITGYNQNQNQNQDQNQDQN